jgi:excisionase family DNA binding protein
MSSDRRPLFVRLPTDQAAALDRLADRTGRPKQHLVSELLADRLPLPVSRPLSVGRVEVANAPEPGVDEVLTLEETSALLRLPPESVRASAEQGDLPGRRFGTEWRFSRLAILAWLGEGGKSHKRRTP